MCCSIVSCEHRLSEFLPPISFDLSFPNPVLTSLQMVHLFIWCRPLSLFSLFVRPFLIIQFHLRSMYLKLWFSFKILIWSDVRRHLQPWYSVTSTSFSCSFVKFSRFCEKNHKHAMCISERIWNLGFWFEWGPTFPKI